MTGPTASASNPAGDRAGHGSARGGGYPARVAIRPAADPHLPFRLASQREGSGGGIKHYPAAHAARLPWCGTRAGATSGLSGEPVSGQDLSGAPGHAPEAAHRMHRPDAASFRSWCGPRGRPQPRCDPAEVRVDGRLRASWGTPRTAFVAPFLGDSELSAAFVQQYVALPGQESRVGLPVIQEAEGFSAQTPVSSGGGQVGGLCASPIGPRISICPLPTSRDDLTVLRVSRQTPQEPPTSPASCLPRQSPSQSWCPPESPRRFTESGYAVSSPQLGKHGWPREMYNSVPPPLSARQKTVIPFSRGDSGRVSIAILSNPLARAMERRVQ